MKKIYSFVLMAAMLLVGTNISAKVFTGSTTADLQKAVADIIYGVENDPVIQLSQPVNLTGTVWVGTQKLDGTAGNEYKSITLDLNGHSITYNGTSGDRTLIALTHGELKIINTASNQAKLQLTGVSGGGATIISVYGSSKSSRWNDAGSELVGAGTNTRVQGWCSHLEIGSNVLLYAEQGCQGTGLYVGTGSLKYPKAKGDGSYDLASVSYLNNVMVGSYGFAYGVRVDFSGEINFQGDNTGKAYGIKVNGTTRSPLSCENSGNEAWTADAKNDSYFNDYYTHNADIDNTKTLATDETHKRDTVEAPFIWVHPGAEIKTRTAGDKVTALYAAGYAKWLVQGYAAGKTGMYVSSGVIDLEDGYIKSTANEWQNTSNIGSANGGGSGVVLNSRDSYSGGIEFTVSGDSKIESLAGYAIEEAVNTTETIPNPAHETDPSAPETIPQTKTSNVTIEGGTISGGDKGAIVVSVATMDASTGKTEGSPVVVVYGGNVTGTTQAGADGDLNTLIDSTKVHTTEVTITNPETGKTQTVVVISDGKAPDVNNRVYDLTKANGSIKWQGELIVKDTIKTDLKLAELEINDTLSNGTPREQILVINDGVKFEAGRVILGRGAKIIVEPGGKFIVSGEQGIVAPVIENIVLRHSSVEEKYATFLFNPAVTSNKHPNATVEFTTNSWRESSEALQWEWFGIPTYNKAKSITSTGYAYVAVYENSAWQNLGYIGLSYDNNPAVLAKLDKPFAAYDLLAIRNHDATAPEITISGELVGNGNGALNSYMKWTPFANSYTAEVDAAALINALSSYSNISDAIYIAKQNTNGTIAWDAKVELNVGTLKLKPMQAFMLLNNHNVEEAAINYASMVYAPATAANAPKRRAASDILSRVSINVENVEGTWDDVELFETNNTKSYEKYLNSDINIYVVDGEKNDIYAVEDLNGTYVGFSTVNGGDFTISFADVEGRQFDIIDLETGARVAIMEGSTYEFHMDANTVADYRFKVVERAEVITAIDNTEAVKNAKGIYTITGQYVGEMNVWNTLPAGVYVVNGEKLVK